MKTQCPECKNIFDVPPEYTREVRCKRCDKNFKPVKFKKPPIVIPNLPSRGNFLTKLWTKSPAAFKTGFLATLGVVSALALCLYVYGRIFLTRPSLKSEAPATELLVPGWERIRNYEIPPCIALYDYEFEEKWDYPWEKEGFFPIIWHAWYFNSYKHWAKGYYHIEFRNINNSLLVALDPIPTTMVPTGESSNWLPREQTGLYWMPNVILRQVDYLNSRIYLREKK